MPTIDQQKKLVANIKEKLPNITVITADQLIREQELGNQLSFKKGEDWFLKIIDLFKQASSVQIDDLPYSVLNTFHTQIDQAINLFNNIKSFNPSVNNPVAHRDSIINQLVSFYDNTFQAISPILVSGLLKSNNLDIERNKINEAIREFEKAKETTQTEAGKFLSEIKEVLDKARQAAVEVGVAQHSIVFKEEADEHKNLSDFWLKWTIGALAAIIIAAVLFILVFRSTETDTSYVIQFSITKIIVLTALFIGLSICTRNYKAHKHNFILNKHRQNALNTFETFSKAAGDDLQTKSAVLLEATHTIFSNQQTGYLPSDSDADSPNKIIEIIKNISPKQQ